MVHEIDDSPTLATPANDLYLVIWTNFFFTALKLINDPSIVRVGINKTLKLGA
jgi:hypothetical protein